jgi:hypothetical protein
MKTLSEKMNFSFKEIDNSIKIESGRCLNYYYNKLQSYCSTYNIDVTNVSEQEFDAAVETMSMYKKNDNYESASYYFSIDQ